LAGTSADDWLLAAVERIEAAADELCDAVAATVESFGDVGRDRAAGRPLLEIVDDLLELGGQQRRRAAGQAIGDYQRAVMEFRAAVIRSLVDDEGMTFTAVAARMGISRQMAARLHRSESRPRT
jgi:hypothetical protein